MKLDLLFKQKQQQLKAIMIQEHTRVDRNYLLNNNALSLNLNKYSWNCFIKETALFGETKVEWL